MPSLRVLKNPLAPYFPHVPEGPTEGAIIPLDAEHVILGRDPGCDIVLPSTSVSRRHARITRVGDGYYVEDLGSRGGTYLNDLQLNGITPLKDGDCIRLPGLIATFLDGSLMPLLPE
jgi:pSer/pThr/pTyr-binding forkhead associated (FHA) protein